MIGRPSRPTAAGLGLLVDRFVGEPPCLHPVVGFGLAMGALERRTWRDSRTAGVAYTAAGVALGFAGAVMTRSTTATVALCAAGRELRIIAADVAARCQAGDLDAARAELRALVGRDRSDLDETAIAAAVIESLAENTVDAVVAPALWGALAGAGGAGAYRAINTMDAMVGHRSNHYRRFGWSAARLDDVANFLPARVFATLVVLVAPAQRGAIVAAIGHQAPAHPSPNAGVAEAAVAAALGVELGGALRYGDRGEQRPLLGNGPRPGPADIARAVALVDRVELVLTALLLLLAAVRAASDLGHRVAAHR